MDLGGLGVFVMWGFVNFDERFDFLFFWMGDVGMFVCVCVFDVLICGVVSVDLMI